ncbi:hypothetical protein AURDEDRAFT_126222 [Auricularia subglabra TFB-10046 SS5]|nr:hypothetical protein AURDEDRAFT_126222 [Auricularia subglabra TFB-10046 SS5]
MCETAPAGIDRRMLRPDSERPKHGKQGSMTSQTSVPAREDNELVDRIATGTSAKPATRAYSPDASDPRCPPFHSAVPLRCAARDGLASTKAVVIPTPAMSKKVAVSKAGRDPMLRLPPELVSATFRPLDFWDRVVVSHVTRTWRALALADALLWTEVVPPVPRVPKLSPDALWKIFEPDVYGSPGLPADVQVPCSPPRPLELVQPPKSNPPQCGAEMLRELLARSDPLPFTVTWPGSSISPGVTVFETLHSAVSVIVENMHRMESLAIAPAMSDIQPLFEIEFLMTDTLDALSDPPPSLTHIDLGTDNGATADYTALIRACAGYDVRTLRLQTAMSFSDSLELFTSVVVGTWSMKLGEANARVIELNAVDEDVLYRIDCEQMLSLRREPRVATQLARLASLTVHAQFLLDLDALGRWARARSGARVMVIACRVKREIARPYQGTFEARLINQAASWKGMASEKSRILVPSSNSRILTGDESKSECRTSNTWHAQNGCGRSQRYNVIIPWAIATASTEQQGQCSPRTLGSGPLA